MSKPQKDDDLRNWMGGSVCSTIQKVQGVHKLECSYASFMLSLRYYVCLFYTKIFTKPNCNICKEECLTIHKKLRDKRVTFMNTNLEIYGACRQIVPNQ